MKSKKKNATKEASNNSDFKRNLIEYLRGYMTIQLKRYCFFDEGKKIDVMETIYTDVKDRIKGGKVVTFKQVELTVAKMIEKKKDMEEHVYPEEDLAMLYLAKHGAKAGKMFF